MYSTQPETCEFCGLPVAQDPGSSRTRWVHAVPCFGFRRAFRDLELLETAALGVPDALAALREVAIDVARCMQETPSKDK